VEKSVRLEFGQATVASHVIGLSPFKKLKGLEIKLMGLEMKKVILL
jgi:hypothetical protein